MLVPPMEGATDPLIIASDGTGASLSALRVGRSIAARHSWPVEIVTVLDPVPVAQIEPSLFTPPTDFDADRRQGLLAAVRKQAEEVFGTDTPRVVLQEGDPAVMIAQFAATRNARVIVLGLSRHGVLDRLLGGDTALEVVRLSHSPVMAVVPGVTSLPTRALVALDFSDASVRAARSALAFIHEQASLVLAHVVSHDLGTLVGKPYEEGCAAAFDAVREALGPEMGARVETVLLRGAPAGELIAYAPEARADLLVAGREGTGAVRRILVGSVATRLLRGADCSVLIVPSAESESD